MASQRAAAAVVAVVVVAVEAAKELASIQEQVRSVA